MKYIVTIQEVWCRDVPVEAESIDEAIEKANKVIESGDLPDERFEYHSTYESDDWVIFNVDNKEYEQ